MIVYLVSSVLLTITGILAHILLNDCFCSFYLYSKIFFVSILEFYLTLVL